MFYFGNCSAMRNILSFWTMFYGTDRVRVILYTSHDDVIKWKHFRRYWTFVRGIHRSPVNSPHKGQWRGALMFSLICPCINGWVNNHEAGDLRRHRAHHNVIVMIAKPNGSSLAWIMFWRLFGRVIIDNVINKSIRPYTRQCHLFSRMFSYRGLFWCQRLVK